MQIKVRTDEIVVIVGSPGSGKTTLAIDFLTKIPESKRIVIDHMGDFRLKLGDKPYIKIPPPGDCSDWLNDLCRQVYSQGNKVLVIDEAEQYAPNVSVPLFKVTKWLGESVHRGTGIHHRNIGVIAITRRLASLHKDIISFASHIFIFQMDGPRDIEAVRFYLGDIAEEVPKLTNHRFIWYNRKAEPDSRITICDPLKLEEGGEGK
jgi:energy-coupling factor transporter ATP-binding protein EcfA2